MDKQAKLYTVIGIIIAVAIIQTSNPMIFNNVFWSDLIYDLSLFVGLVLFMDYLFFPNSRDAKWKELKKYIKKAYTFAQVQSLSEEFEDDIFHRFASNFCNGLACALQDEKAFEIHRQLCFFLTDSFTSNPYLLVDSLTEDGPTPISNMQLAFKRTANYLKEDSGIGIYTNIDVTWSKKDFNPKDLRKWENFKRKG